MVEINVTKKFQKNDQDFLNISTNFIIEMSEK